MRQILACLTATTMLATALTVPAAAQAVRNLDRETSNQRVFSGYVGTEPVRFEVSVPAGASLKVDAVSTSSVDPFLTITDARTGNVLGEDDDSGGGLNAQLTLRSSDTDRRIAIAVSQFTLAGAEAVSAGGTFELRLNSFVPKPATPVTWGTVIEGTVEQGAERSFSFRGEPGMVLEVAMMAADENGFDPYLRLLDDAGEELAADDDGGNGVDAVLRYLMSDNAPLTIVASGYGEGPGNFTLRVGERRELIVQAPLQLIGLADTAMGRLDVGYEAGGIDPISIDYELDAAAQSAIVSGIHEVTITMRAAGDEAGMGGGLDSFLELGFETPLGFAIVMTDDDSAGDLNAMIPVDLSALAADPAMLGRLRIRAKAFSGSTGNYTLTITQGLEAMPAMDIDVIEADGAAN